MRTGSHEFVQNRARAQQISQAATPAWPVLTEHHRRLAVHHVDAARGGKHQHAVIQHFHDRFALLEQTAQAKLFSNGTHRRLDHPKSMSMVLLARLSDVQHADQFAVGRKNRRGGTAPAFAAEPEMFGPDDFHRLPFGQTGADAVGAVGFFRGVVARIKYDKALQFFFMPHGMNNQPGFVRQADNAA